VGCFYFGVLSNPCTWAEDKKEKEEKEERERNQGSQKGKFVRQQSLKKGEEKKKKQKKDAFPFLLPFSASSVAYFF
jgi:hypothetical protein